MTPISHVRVNAEKIYAMLHSVFHPYWVSRAATAVSFFIRAQWLKNAICCLPLKICC